MAIPHPVGIKRALAFICLTACATASVVSTASAGTTGAFDAEFGVDGTVLFGKFGASAGATGVAVAKTGRIIVAVNESKSAFSSTKASVLYAFNNDGSRAKGFGKSGSAVVSASSSSYVMKAAENDEIFVLDASDSFHAFDPAGQRLDAVGAGGTVDLAKRFPDCDFSNFAIQGPSRIVIAGSTKTSPDGTNGYMTAPCIVALSRSGAPDGSFGTAGSLTIGHLRAPAAEIGIGVDPASNILVGLGGRPDPAKQGAVIAQSGVVRLTENGAIDTSFGSEGVSWLIYENAASPSFRTSGVQEILATTSGALYVVAAEGYSHCSKGCGFQSNLYFVPESGSTPAVVRSGFQTNALALGPGDRVAGSRAAPRYLAVSLWSGSGSPNSVVPGDSLNTAVLELESSSSAVAFDPRGNIVVAGSSSPFDPTDQFESRPFVSRLLGSTSGRSAAQIQIDDFYAPGSASKSKLEMNGVALPHAEVRRVQVAIQRSSTSLRRRGLCQWVKSKKVRYVTRRLRRGLCPNPVFVTLSNRAKWSGTFSRGFQPGKHSVWVRATLSSGEQNEMIKSKDSYNRFKFYPPKR